MIKKLFLFFLFSFVPASHALDKTIVFEDRVVASIDGEPIVMSELEKFAKEQNLSIDNSKSKKQVLRDMISIELLKKEAQKEGISASDEEIENYISGVAEQNGLSRVRFEQKLKSQGLSLAQYKEQVRQDIIRTRILALRVRSKINVLDEDIENYFEKNPELMPKEGEAQLYQISLSGEGAIQEVIEIRNQILAGADFREAGGVAFSDLGYVNVADLKEELQQAVSELKAGEMSKIMTSGDSQFFIKLVHRVGDGKELPDSLKQKVTNEIYQELYQAKLNDYLSKELSKSYYVEVNL